MPMDIGIETTPFEFICRNPLDYTMSLIREHYDYGDQEASLKRIRNALYRDLYRHLEANVEPAQLTKGSFPSEIKRVMTGFIEADIPKGIASEIVPLEEVQYELSHDPTNMTYKMAKNNAVLPFWLEQCNNPDIIKVYDKLVRLNYIDSVYEQSSFRMCFTKSDPLERSVHDIIRLSKEINPIPWLQKTKLKCFINELEPKLGLNGIPKYKYLSGLTEIDGEPKFNLGNLNNGGYNPSQSVQEKISSIISAHLI